MQINPFNFKTLHEDAPFCNRVKEIASLVHAAESGNDVVLYAPRRYGKTSLVKRAQKKLADQGAITISTDFSGVASINDVAKKLATGVYEVTRENEPLWKKAVRLLTSFRPVLRPSSDGTSFEVTAEAASGRTGLELLDSVMEDIGAFSRESSEVINIAFDEFQDIVALPAAAKIEACMRSHIQQYRGSHFFVGSQRRILSAMFNEEERPFFRSAINMHLGPLPEAELVPFVTGLFTAVGKKCSHDTAATLVSTAKCHPYYTQKLGHCVFERTEGIVTLDDVREGMEDVLADSRPFFESMVNSLPPQQRLVLRALAKEPTDKLMANIYIRKHDLGSTSAISHSLKQLSALDYIESDENRVWFVVDPVFSLWISKQWA